MKIEFLKDTNKRYCSICKKRILKGKLYMKYKTVIDQWNNTRMVFFHVDCMIKKLQSFKKKADKEAKKVPEINIYLKRVVK